MQRNGRVLVTPRSLQPTAADIHHPVMRLLVEAGCDIVYPQRRGPFGADVMRDLVRDVDAAIVGLDVVDRTVIETTTCLKVIARFGVGVDRVDIAAATERGIVVTHTPEANSVAVAEYTVALMLAALRHLAEHHAGVLQGRWDVRQGRELAGKRLGLIGLGHVGLEVAKRCRAFQMEIGYFDIVRRPRQLEQELQLEYMSLDALLGWADVLSLHAPQRPGAPPLLGAEALARVKAGAVLVNTARGGLVDELALGEALREGRLAAAALDVFSHEPLPDGHPLRKYPNVLLSPHAASHTAEAAERMARQAVASVLDVMRGCRPESVVNKEVLDRLGLHACA